MVVVAVVMVVVVEVEEEEARDVGGCRATQQRGGDCEQGIADAENGDGAVEKTARRR